MKKQVLGLFAMLFLLGVFIISCDESLLDDIVNDSKIEEEDQQTVIDNSEAELKTARVFENINNFGISEDGKKNTDLEGCPDVQWAGKVLTLDFSSCTSGNSGKIIAEFSVENPTYGTLGLTADVTFDGYTDEGTAMNGKIRLSLTGLASGGDVGPTFKVEVLEDLSFTEGSETHVWHSGSERIIKWMEGFATPANNADDVYTLEGNSSGVNKDGIEYEVNITSALYFDMACEWVPKGVLEIVNHAGSDDEKSLTINFDSGETAQAETGQCDSWVLITAGSISVRINVNQ